MTEPWTQTRHGRAFDLLAPRAQDVALEDISAGLSKIARFNGATIGAHAYSVAQHCVLVAEILRVWGAPLEIQREGLLHDAPETYYGDVTSPMMVAVERRFATTICDAIEEGPARDAALARSPMRGVMKHIDAVVRTALGLPAEEHPLVNRADLVALSIERRHLMAGCDRDWSLPEYPDTRWTNLEAVEPFAAQLAFEQRLRQLDESILDAAEAP